MYSSNLKSHIGNSNIKPDYPSQVVEWKPIDEAPKNGTPVILYGKAFQYDLIQVGSYKNGRWVLQRKDVFNNKLHFLAPTHFMFMPNAPR